MEAALASAALGSTKVVLAAFNTLLAAGLLWPKKATVKDGDSFCYIVVGSGVGSVVANRLSEDENCTVLLIEAGGYPTVESMFPGLFVTLQNSGQDWSYKSEKEEASQSQIDNNFNVAAGKSLGGSSAINHLIHLRGAPCDFNSWADKLNDTSYQYDNLLPYFKKAENLKDNEILSAYPKFHSTSGPTSITKEPKKASKKYLEAFREMGNNVSIDQNRNITTGYSEAQCNVDILRQSTAQAYLHNIRNRTNLKVLINAEVIKILFDDDKNAKGVVLVLGSGDVITLYAKHEIIVSCGVFNTPKLLMLSGIGPKNDLEKLNIPVISDLEVGKNLQEHVAIVLVHKMEYSLEISELPGLTYVPFPMIIGAVNLEGDATCPEYQTTNMVFTHDLPYLTLVLTDIFGYNYEIAQNFTNSAVGRNTLVTMVSNVHPLSHGYVKLRSANYIDSPIIKLNFYSNNKDFDKMVSFVRDFINVINSTYFKTVGAELISIDLPGCSNLTFWSTDYIKCYIMHMTTTLYHATSTCPMGKVVDTELNVIGVKRLRIVDASVFPNITRANPLASAVALAEKISDVIKTKYNCSCGVSETTNSITNIISKTKSKINVLNIFG